MTSVIAAVSGLTLLHDGLHLHSNYASLRYQVMRKEPTFGNLDGAEGENWARLMDDQPGDRDRTVRVKVHHRFDSDAWPLSRVLTYVVVAVVAVAAVGLVGRMAQLRHAEEAKAPIVSSSTAATGQIQRDVAANERAAREKVERAAAERRAIQDKNAQSAAVQKQALRKERAWASFYEPTDFCKKPDNRSSIQCSNEIVRAKRNFERRWAEGKV